MSRRPKKEDTVKKPEVPAVEKAVNELNGVFCRVSEGMDMATGREEMQQWWQGLDEEVREEIAKEVFERVDRMRKITDAMHQEFTTLSMSYR